MNLVSYINAVNLIKTNIYIFVYIMKYQFTEFFQFIFLLRYHYLDNAFLFLLFPVFLKFFKPKLFY